MHISLPVIITTADARTRRQHKHKLWTLPANCTPYQQSLYVRCIPLWNALTEEAVTASNVDRFSVNHGLPAFLFIFNVLIILLIYLF